MRNVKSIANVPVSQPIYQADQEKETFNGFAWGRQGIIHQSKRQSPGNIQDWFGNN